MVYLTETMQDNFQQRSLIFEFARTKEGKKVIKKINNFHPYFFVKEDVKINDNRIIKEIKGFNGLGDVKLKKCIVKLSSDIRNIKEQLNDINVNTFEADIPFNNRYMIDRCKTIESVPLKIFSLDIETNYNNVSPDMETADQEITCIGIQDSFSSNKYVFVWREDFELVEERLDDCIVFKHTTEESMLNSFANFIRDESPDMITGWNVDKFDMYYIILRMQRLEIDFRKLSPIRSVHIDDRYQDVTIKGIVIFDLLKYYKSYRKMSNQTELLNYKLDTVAKDVLGSEKIKFEKSLGWQWKNDIDTLIKYNIRDVELVLDIDKKLKVINFFDSLRIMAKCQFEDITKTTIMLDSYILSKYPDIKLPSKKKHGKSKFKGAFVGDPIPGLHKNVLCLDIKGMYPNIMKTFNISPETFNPESGEIRISDTVAFDKKEGMIPKILKSLGKKRENYKEIKRKSVEHSAEWDIAHYRQYGIKVIMNAFYGYLGAPSSRFYIKAIAETITTFGRDIIHWTNDIITDNKYTVVYNDTDSVASDSKIIIFDDDNNKATMSIEELFYSGYNFIESNKQSVDSQFKTYYYDLKTDKIKIAPIKKIIRHSVNKKKYTIKTKTNTIEVTEDHSIYVKRNNKILEIKPFEILNGDKLIELETFK